MRHPHCRPYRLSKTLPRHRPAFVLLVMLLAGLTFLAACGDSPGRPLTAPLGNLPPFPASSQACTSFCLANGDTCVFGSNQDNTNDEGLLVVNPRHQVKTGWQASATGDYARWISRYGSVAFDYAGYQQAWAGMNEAGLMMSTMALNRTENPPPDARPPLVGSFWMQYQLDNHSTVEEVIASDQYLRIADTVDHYLACDRSGDCAVIEFLDGRMVAHAGRRLAVPVLANALYARQAAEWRAGSDPGSRFSQAAARLQAFAPASPEEAVAYAFETLADVALPFNAWQIVFDPAQLRVYFRTNRNPQVRYLDFSQLDFTCGSPALMAQVQAPGSGDISDDLVPYTHAAGLAHSLQFFERYDRLDYPPVLIDILLRGMESFPCARREADLAAAGSLLGDDGPLLPPPVAWAGLVLLQRLWPAWIMLVALSVALLVWHVTSRGQATSRGQLAGWGFLVLLLGPLGLLAYAVAYRRRKGTERAKRQFRRVEGAQPLPRLSKESDMQRSRFIAGLLLVAAAVFLLLSEDATLGAGAIGLGILGIIMIAISRRERLV